MIQLSIKPVIWLSINMQGTFRTIINYKIVRLEKISHLTFANNVKIKIRITID